MSRYEEAKKMYSKLSINTDEALEKLQNIKISVHCWQGDDVNGFDTKQNLSGGIQTTGNYLGKARNYQELMQDMDKAFSLIPGKHKLNLHASYAIFEDGEFADRDKLEPKHFKKWVDFAKERNMGIDFNPTFFSHPKASQFTLSSPDEEIRKFWVEHGKACIRISQYFAEELNEPCVMNIWIPDGYKDIPADRMSPRVRFQKSLDEILSIDYDKEKVLVCLESKVFGIGLESYTVGSAEFCINYAASRGIMPLMDNGHYHPTESIYDKISSMLLFNKNLALHITRPVRWDSDHVILFNDEVKEICKEITRCDDISRIKIATDYFDASINRIAAWVIGIRNVQKALLFGLLQPNKTLYDLQMKSKFTQLMFLQEEIKTYPFGDVWNEFCNRNNVIGSEEWFKEIEDYEKNVLVKRV
ncbi:L-rhamnose isomerase [Brachyspira suanatina]|uniref:L-rhamnose isomerase n=1 Tax=Brachyspira suanatina TaxID=381802 RepID=A0A0G4K929_9SPIR|nr:L-rhamnose isomerase [Brachyspira suanatina]CRF34618.1 L-rhamnose isomerase [Brachyspira suanatina]